MPFPRLVVLLAFASMVATTPMIKESNLIAARDGSDDCGTSTVTVTSTITPSGQQTSSADIVSVTSTVSSITTAPAGSTQLTCFPSATTLAPAAPARKEKRDSQGYKVFEFIVDCECEGQDTHTTTSFSTSYFGAAATTAVESSCSSATTTTTITSTISTATVGASTTTVTTTVVSTASAAATAGLSPQAQGLNYYFFTDQTYPTPQNGFVNVTEVPALVNVLSNNPGFAHSGTVANINALQIQSPNDNDPTIYYSEDQTITMPDGYQSHGNHFGIIFQGYLYAAAGAGTYTIQSVTLVMDDLGLVWVGAKALGNNWNNANADYQVILTEATQQTSVQLAAGEALPITIFYANVDGPGRASFNVVTPDGTVHDDTTGFFVGGCGNAGFNP